MAATMTSRKKDEMPAAPAARPEQLPLFASYDVTVIPTADGGAMIKRGRLQIKGGTRQAAKVLGCSPDTVRRMVEDGTIPARKMRPNRPNSKLVVDMLVVYDIAKRQL